MQNKTGKASESTKLQQLVINVSSYVIITVLCIKLAIHRLRIQWPAYCATNITPHVPPLIIMPRPKTHPQLSEYQKHITFWAIVLSDIQSKRWNSMLKNTSTLRRLQHFCESSKNKNTSTLRRLQYFFVKAVRTKKVRTYTCSMFFSLWKWSGAYSGYFTAFRDIPVVDWSAVFFAEQYCRLGQVPKMEHWEYLKHVSFPSLKHSVKILKRM